jgi:hypothetical protein
MNESLKNYADTLYEKTRFESSQQLRADRVNLLTEMARTSQAALPMSGPELTRVLKLYAQHIERCMEARLDSYQKAFKEANNTPNDQEFREILSSINDAQQLEIKHSAQALNGFMTARGLGGRDSTGSLTENSAQTHDRVLNNWKVWRGQIQLKSALAGIDERAKGDPSPISVTAQPQPDKSPIIYFLLGSVCSILPWGASLIGITVNLWLGAAVFLISFWLIGYAFWLWEKPSRWHVALRIGTVILGGVIYIWIIGKQIVAQYRKEVPPATRQVPFPNPQPISPRSAESSPASTPSSTPISGSATTSGPNSPAVTGNENHIKYSQSPNAKKKSKPK